MKFRYIKSILSAASLLLAVSVTSCIGDLDATPIDPNIVMTFDQASVFNNFLFLPYDLVCQPIDDR